MYNEWLCDAIDLVEDGHYKDAVEHLSINSFMYGEDIDVAVVYFLSLAIRTGKYLSKARIDASCVVSDGWEKECLKLLTCKLTGEDKPVPSNPRIQYFLDLSNASKFVK